MHNLVFEKETFKIIGACIKVHKKLGSGFTESVYIEAVTRELEIAQIQFEQHKEVPVYYNGEKLGTNFLANLVAYDTILIELTTVPEKEEAMKHEIIKELQCTNLEVGLLLNFGGKSLTWNRFINSPKSTFA